MAGDPEPADRRNHWAGLLKPPSIRERVSASRQLAGKLLASSDEIIQEFGKALNDALHGRGALDIQDMLGIRPRRGSRLNAPRIILQEKGDAKLMALSTLAGGDRAAVRLLATPGQAPDVCRALISEIQREGWATSYAAFGRARKRSKKANQLIADEPTNPEPDILFRRQSLCESRKTKCI